VNSGIALRRTVRRASSTSTTVTTAPRLISALTQPGDSAPRIVRPTATTTIQPSDTGMSSFQPNAMNWS
jgi:hypothetical protein